MHYLVQQTKRFISRYIIRRPAISMWKKRVKQYGARAALNISHSDDEIKNVTRLQKEQIFPFLEDALNGDEKVLLDLGCGPGRFTPDLAALIQGKAIGVDPILDFLSMAPKDDQVEYRHMTGSSSIPLASESVDVVWICLVLGGIINRRSLLKIIAEVDRVLKPGGLLVLIENTTDTKDGEYWKFHSVEFYQSLIYFAPMQHLSDYLDLNERHSILLGRKQVRL